MALYGIIMHWDEYDGPNGHFPRQDFFFISNDAESYLEVTNLNIRDQGDADWWGAKIDEDMTGGRTTKDGKRFLPMRFARRYFAQEEQAEGRYVHMDCRIWPPITQQEDMEHGCLPEGVKYPHLGKKAQANT